MKNFLKFAFITTIFICSNTSLIAQLQDVISNAKRVVKNYSNNNKKGSSLTSAEIANGLKQALEVGAQNATGQVSAMNGFFGNSLIKILMPPDAKKVETRLRAIGVGDQVDKAILTMNRGAEDASKKALPVFVNAIKSMTIEDGLNILKGSNNAATQFLKNKTYNSLYQAFLPIIKTSLDRVEATKYWAEVFRIYNEIPFVDKVNTDLPSYVTQRALEGVFTYIAVEEGKIRTNPAARITDLLKKVFGS